MHQPEYRDGATGEFTMPWVYLHAIKDYTDMAWHLEQHPGVRAVVNFVPVLLDQLEDYCAQFASGDLRDPLLRLLARSEDTPLSEAERARVLERCFHSNHHKMIAPYPPYKHLHELFASIEAMGKESIAYLSDQYVFDLLTWYHLSWTGESVRRGSKTVARLMTVGTQFSREDRGALVATIAELVRAIIPRFRRLAESGRIELSTTPHYHPLAPLLIDLRSALDAEPAAKLPEAQGYSGGRGRVMAQLDQAIEAHARRFGARARGVWPAEGAVSPALLSLLETREVAWTASGEGVLANSLRKRAATLPARGEFLYRPYRVPSAAQRLACFFRDDRLSDLIGFEYSKWHGRDAAANFVAELETIAAGAPVAEPPLVSVILDGENAWEYYPYNGFYFLSALYESLEKHPAIRTSTYSAVIEEESQPATRRRAWGELPLLVAGSWVHGNFATWIGSPDKNRAWDLLCAAKASFDLVIASGRLNEQQKASALRQLADCESSDWFWWFGDYNPAEAVAAFELAYRTKLANLYRLLELPVPAALSVPISLGRGHPESGGAMRRAS
ncbi:MAG: glycoside hydrolase [Betaproteobacteria bacterium]|nr:glycoside hydrolase [Betaproteobacteria bacterium]